MKERAFRADAREAKGLHDGSITRVVRVVDFPDDRRWTDVLGPYSNGGFLFTRPVSDWHEDLVRMPPFGVPGDRLHSVCEPGEPCEHRGCLSHVTHVCEGCGRGHAGILLDVTDVRVVRAQEVEWKDMEFTGLWTAFAEYRRESCINRDCAEVLGRLRIQYFRQLIGEDVFDANTWLWLGTVAKVDRKPLAPKPVDA